MKLIFALVYLLVLVTQLPHVWSAYAQLEDPTIPMAIWTALGAALAFEASIGIFTYRIVNGSRRRWTRRGLAFFIVASIVANGFYYGWLPFAFDLIWPVFATIALPIALALFAEEFGAEVKREERAAKRAERKAERVANEQERKPNASVPLESFVCPVCGDRFRSQNALAGHMNKHRDANHHQDVRELLEA